MTRTDLFFKVEVEHEPNERMEKIVAEIERQIRRVYIVRSVEFSSAIIRSSD